MLMRERLRYIRTLYGLSQKDVADAMGKSKQYITAIENGSCNTTATQETLERILNVIYKIGEAKKRGRLKEIMEDLKNQNKENK